jgi:hypothetical protein
MPTPAATITHAGATSSAPPNPATASAVPTIVDALGPLLGALVHLGSSIVSFNLGDAVHNALSSIDSAVHTLVSPIVNAITTGGQLIENAVLTVLWFVALPIEIPLALYALHGLN